MHCAVTREPPALVGFDDFDLADLLDVTVIAHDPERMGELGAELVVSRLNGEQGPARRVLLPTELIARGSGERGRPSGRGRGTAAGQLQSACLLARHRRRDVLTARA